MKAPVLAAIGMAVALAGNAGRIRYTIDDDWLFNGQRVNLPHTWNAADAFDKRTPYRRGSGTYEKSLTLDPSLRGRRLFLYFEGANQVADVFVNGHHAGQHAGGYTAFVFEITDLVTFDEANAIEVRVDNSPNPDVPPLGGDFVFYGGIYRDVWLIATAPVHIDVMDHASPGVFIRTDGDVVHVKGRVVNQSGREADVRVVNSVIDADGKVVATASAHVSSAFDQTLRVEHPHLWSPAAPYLYTVRTEVFDGDQRADSVESTLGFRTFSVDAQRGFTLNGRPLRLFGTNRHQDSAGLGNALSDDLHRRDIHLIKETGFNFLRLAHYPQDPAVLDAADREGLVVWEEIPVVDMIGTSDAFAANAERMLVEMIRQHANHPSVFFWGFMNEVTQRHPDPLPPNYDQSVVALARRLNARAHAEDATRKTVMALSMPEIDARRDLSAVTDILGMNLYFGWYYDAFPDLGAFLDRVHRERPDRPLIVSEYGAGDDERIHSREPKRFDFSAEYAQESHRESFPQLEARPYLVATAVWNQFDFAAPRDDTKFGINSKGLFLYDRTPKDTWLYYRAALLGTPVLAIGREWRHRAGDRVQPVTVYTNQPECELFVNGRSAGKRKVENRTATWNVDLTGGENRISAHAGSLEDSIVLDSQSTLAVNAGSDAEYDDSSDVVWQADRGFTGGVAVHTNHRIFDTSDDPLYQSAREGMQQYRFAVADGAHEVTLRFAEIDAAVKPGDRVFSIRINGIEVIHDLDLAARYGAFTALSRTFTVETRDGGGIVVEFAAKSGKACIAAVMIR